MATESVELDPRIKLAELMLIYWNRKVIGTIELRNWLSEVFPEFKSARRSDVDDMIEKWGEEQANPPEDEEEISVEDVEVED
jgi:hypothetical protein